MYRLKRIELIGFRGFAVATSIDFGNPITVIHGRNRTGKSSIVNAIEWCLFGYEVGGISYGQIRERDAWEIKNLNSSTCQVTCEFVDDSGAPLSVKRRYKSTRLSDLEFRPGSGPTSKDEAELRTLLNVTPADFIASVHLHPEVIRTLVVATPKDRKAAIDRLLGLSELREMVSALDASNPNGWSTWLAQQRTILDEMLAVSLREKTRTIEEEMAVLREKGHNAQDMSDSGAVKFASELVDRINSFAKQYSLNLKVFQEPIAFEHIQQVRGDISSHVGGLRSAHPALADQGKLRTSMNTLEGIRDAIEHQNTQTTQAKASLEGAVAASPLSNLKSELAGTEGEIQRIDSAMKLVSQNAELLKSAVDFFRSKTPSDTILCPICGKTEFTADDWQRKISEDIKANNLAPLQKQRDENSLLADKLRKSISNVESLDKTLERQVKLLEHRRAELAKHLNRSLSESDDAVALANREISESQKRIDELQSQVEAINKQYDEFHNSLGELDQFIRVGRARRDMHAIEARERNTSYLKLSEVQSKCEEFAEDVRLLVAGLKNATTVEAGKKLQSVQSAISKTFTEMTDRPDYPGLKVSASGDGYSIELTKDITKESPTTKAVPILNHGDLNCAALSVFLALASAPQISHRLGFLILDDASQSLDPTCKSNIAKVLDEVSTTRQVIVATTDDEFRVAIESIPKTRVSILTKDWSPSIGPKIETVGA